MGYFCTCIFKPVKMRTIFQILSRKKIGLTLLAGMLVFQTESLRAQCAMCRAVVEQGGEEVAEGINSGIVYLMAFPYIVVAVALYLLYRNWRRTSSAA